MVPSYTELSNLEHLFKGDKALMREWIGLYLQESPAYFEQLTASLESGDAQALASAAHDLQPQAHYLGSARMVELLAGIEERALNGDTLGCGELLKALLPVRAAIDGELRSVLNAS
jgi:HPt (histidine-containing phosphotransfer) domain-containing protein